MRRGKMVCQVLSLSFVLLFPFVAFSQAPTIDTEPVSVEACGSADPVTFTVFASGAPVLRYQWRKDGIDIVGATSFGYSIAAPVAADGGDYDVVVSNDEGDVTSTIATLTFAPLIPTIFDEPVDDTQCLGDDAMFTVGAAGSELSYQWRLDGVDIPGATLFTILIDPVLASDAGDYEVVVSNPCGEVTSVSVTLFVNFMPEIETEPQDLEVCRGDMATLSIVASGGANLDYQWRKDGVDIAGETTETLVIDATTLSDDGDYDVVLSNPCGTTTSSAAKLTIAEDPVIDVDVLDQTICVDEVTTFSVVASSAVALSYQWRVDGVNIPGATAATLTLNPTAAADTGDYDVLVTNLCATVTSSTATLTVPDDPIIGVDIEDHTACAGDEVTFSVTASGIIPLSYQWRLDGIDIPGETSDTFTIGSAAVGDAGDYDVAVTNTCATVLSATAILQIAELPVIDEDPAGLTVCKDDPVTLTVVTSSLIPVSYQWRFNGTDISGETAGTLFIAAAQVSDTGDYDVAITNTCGTVTSTIASVAVAEVPLIEEDISDQTVCAGAEVTFSVTATSILVDTYQWQRDGIDLVGETASSLVLTDVTPADSDMYAVNVTNTCGSVTSALANLVVAEIPAITTEPVTQTLCAGDELTLSVAADSVIPLSYQWRLDGVELTDATGDSLTIASVIPADSGDYDVVVTNDCGTVTSATATITVAEVPFIDVAPEETETCLGDPATLTVTASSVVPFTYQWRHDGDDLAGETSDTLTIVDATVDNAGDYEVVLTNICGTTTTTAVALFVGDVPVIDVEPQGQDTQSKDSITLSVEVTSAVSLSYQWVKDGADIEGATESSLVIESMALADAGDYHVEVSSACGDATSATATLTLPEFRRGDSNRDDQVNVADLVYSITYLFNDGGTPGCMDSADLNNDGLVDVADVIFEIRYLFLGGAVPPSPGPEDCGPDTEDEIDDLDCLVVAESCT